MAPLGYIGRYMKGWWDYAIADELHQLAQETAQGNNLGVLYRCSRKLIGLTGTLMGGYADDLFNLFYRMKPRQMAAEGFAAGGSGRRDFAERYGVLESIEKIPDADNACTRLRRRQCDRCGSRRLATSLRQVPHGVDGLCDARGHSRVPPLLRRERRRGGDGCDLGEAYAGSNKTYAKRSRKTAETEV